MSASATAAAPAASAASAAGAPLLTVNGIATGLHYPVPVYRNAPFAAFAPKGETETDRISAEALSLPFWPDQPEEVTARVCDSIRRFFA